MLSLWNEAFVSTKHAASFCFLGEGESHPRPYFPLPSSWHMKIRASSWPGTITRRDKGEG